MLHAACALRLALVKHLGQSLRRRPCVLHRVGGLPVVLRIYWILAGFVGQLASSHTIHSRNSSGHRQAEQGQWGSRSNER